MDPRPATSTSQPPAGEACCSSAAHSPSPEAARHLRPLPLWHICVRRVPGRRWSGARCSARNATAGQLPHWHSANNAPRSAATSPPTLPPHRFGAALACDAATTLSVGLSEGSQVGMESSMFEGIVSTPISVLCVPAPSGLPARLPWLCVISTSLTLSSRNLVLHTKKQPVPPSLYLYVILRRMPSATHCAQTACAGWPAAACTSTTPALVCRWAEINLHRHRACEGFSVGSRPGQG